MPKPTNSGPSQLDAASSSVPSGFLSLLPELTVAHWAWALAIVYWKALKGFTLFLLQQVAMCKERNKTHRLEPSPSFQLSGVAKIWNSTCLPEGLCFSIHIIRGLDQLSTKCPSSFDLPLQSPVLLLSKSKQQKDYWRSGHTESISNPFGRVPVLGLWSHQTGIR